MNFYRNYLASADIDGVESRTGMGEPEVERNEQSGINHCESLQVNLRLRTGASGSQHCHATSLYVYSAERNCLKNVRARGGVTCIVHLYRELNLG